MILYLRLINLISSRLFAAFVGPFFGAYGKNSYIVSPVGIEGVKNIYISDNVYIAARTCLATKALNAEITPKLEIRSGCRLGRFNHIYATGKIVIEEKVLTANGVYISDNQHEYFDPDLAIMDQPLVQKAAITIGSGTWLGHNVCVMGASVGKHCVIGANSVVISDIPDYSIAVGIPARIIRRYDRSRGVWVAVD